MALNEQETQPGLNVLESPRAGVEAHHIDIIPLSERHGKPRDQFTLWFAANANVVNFVLGGLGIAFGLNLFWAIVAVVVGTALGMLLTALHAWQGPRLGVPQMIQSRGQFGFYGANFILLASILLDVGYLAAQQVLQGKAMNLLVPSLNIPAWIIIVTLPAVALAIFGYRWIHGIQKILTVVFVGVIIAAVAEAAAFGTVAHKYVGWHLSSGPIFIAVVGLWFMNMLSWAPYVSDYSRYLPPNVSFSRTFWAIFSGNALASCLFAGLGAWVTTMVPSAADNPLGALSGLTGAWVLFFMALSQLPGDTLNAYTGMMAVVSLGSHIRGVVEGRGRQAWRIGGILLLFVIGTVLALLGYKSFLTSFENFIDVLLFFFVPWSAINLVDYYLVRHGHYDVRSFFDRHGVYGAVRWPACIIYVLTLAIQVPFLDQTFYTGPFVADLGGADISWIVGFFFASVAYLVISKVTRSADPAAAAPAPPAQAPDEAEGPA